ncbi:Membrane-bound metallopeptidase [hydrothermal vent metagenome]|uniref:Membrane-bound metallopeptidase n=1 Tax=hydrothermal vent metagenome TaxID=652676 RepID=A0A1W1CY47_9ZZZZ
MQFLFLMFFLVVTTLFGGANIDKKIDKTSSKLNLYKKNYVDINKKLKETADAILKQKSMLQKQMEVLKELKEEIATKEQSYTKDTKQLEILKKSQMALKEKQNKIEEKLVFFIARSVSLSVLLEEKYSQNEESLIEIEVLKRMLKSVQDEVKKFNNSFYENEKEINLLQIHADTLQANITEMDKKRKQVKAIARENKIALAKLQKEKLSYTKQLKIVLKRQNSLKNTLEKLHIIKQDKMRKERERKEQEDAFAQQDITFSTHLPKVKRHGSSYQRVKTIRYRGKKTIAPLRRYTITKKYGTYIDPIYGIKIFNESISLQPKSPNAKVRNVMNGKVVYADKTAVLDNMVIVEHKNGLHTIYANLSQIAPNIHKGRKIRRGTVVGRIRDELIFEVTKKNYHINPIRLFR